LIACLVVLLGCVRQKVIGTWELAPAPSGQVIRFFDHGSGTWEQYGEYRASFRWRIDEAWSPDQLILSSFSEGPYVGKSLTADFMTDGHALTLYRITATDTQSPHTSSLEPLVFERMLFCGGVRRFP
jgi:hypothetical protein